MKKICSFINKLPAKIILYLILGFILILVFIIFAVLATVHATPDATMTQEEQMIAAEVQKMEEDPVNGSEWQSAEDFTYITPAYSNSSILICKLSDGYTLEIGEGTGSVDALHIHPKVSSDQHHSAGYGVYVQSSGNHLKYADEAVESTPQDDETYIIQDRTYDELISSYNLLWTDDIIVAGEENREYTISFRVIDFGTYSVIGTAECKVVHENGAFTLKDLQNTDIQYTEEYTAEQRAQFVESAIDFAINAEALLVGDFSMCLDREEMREKAVVEKSEKPYFSVLLDNRNLYIKASTISNFNTIAVTMPTKSLGPLTVYLASEFQMKGYSFETATWKKNVNYIPFGYDLLCPITEDALIIPPSLYGLLS